MTVVVDTYRGISAHPRGCSSEKSGHVRRFMPSAQASSSSNQQCPHWPDFQRMVRHIAMGSLGGVRKKVPLYDVSFDAQERVLWT